MQPEQQMAPSEHTVVVLGASPKPGRYSNQAVRLLKEQGYRVIPVHPRFPEIEELPVAPAVSAIQEPVDTLTLYVGAERSQPLIDDIVALKPGRVIFNPGSESAELERALKNNGITFFHACTLVMLRTRQF